MTQRLRASTPRTKFGCSNCRQRRIKCDESAPSCQRCLRSGWTCPGYVRPGPSSPVSASAAGPVVSDSKATTDSRTAMDWSGISHYSLPYKFPGSQDDRRALHYFNNFAAVELTGYLPSDFWTRMILQRCQHNVSVRHAAAALGKLHMEYTFGLDATTAFAADPKSVAFTPSEEVVAVYRRSMKALRAYIERTSPPDRVVVLMCSAMFHCFELMRGDRRSALSHLQSGLDILTQWKEDCNRMAADQRSVLLDIFARMDLQATMFDDGRHPTLNLEEEAAVRTAADAAISPYATAQQAYQALFPILHKTSRFLVEIVPYKFADSSAVPGPALSQRARIIEQYDFWEKSVHLFERATRLSFEAHQVLSEAKLQETVIKMLLLHSLQDSVSASAPTYDDNADQILDYARFALSTDSDASMASTGNSLGSQQKRTFSLHFGIIAPLTLLVYKTLRPEIRESAVQLLQTAGGKRESYYDAAQMVNVLRGLAKIQEADLGSSVHARDSERADESEGETAKGSKGSSLQLSHHPFATPALEWTMDTFFPDTRRPENKVERWEGFDKLLALVA